MLTWICVLWQGISSYALHLGADADDSNISSSASDSDCRSYTQPLPSTTVPLPNPPLPHVVRAPLLCNKLFSVVEELQLAPGKTTLTLAMSPSS